MSKKRAIESTSSNASPAKTAKKVHPFFTRAAIPASKLPLQWLTTKTTSTCLHGVHLSPKNASKVAAFDLDGTIIKGGRDIKWWVKSVPSALQDAHHSGYSIVIFSNQLQGTRRSVPVPDWKRLIGEIAFGIPDIPFRIFAATARDGFRKPIPGMWYELERLFQEDGVSIDHGSSFFVGDAAGRPGDHADTDRKWAMNVGIRFFTPQEYFLKSPPTPFVLNGFHVSTLPQLPPVTPTSTPILPPPPRSKPELVVFCGYPSLGKTSFFRRHFLPEDYAHVNQDTLRTRQKCLEAVGTALAADRSYHSDNTNRDVQTRKLYIELAKKLAVPVRCFLFVGSFELAWHNNLYRAYNLPLSVASSEPKRELLPYSAFMQFREQYEEPTLSEGFSEIKKVNFVFEGTVEEKTRWSMWLH